MLTSGNNTSLLNLLVGQPSVQFFSMEPKYIAQMQETVEQLRLVLILKIKVA